MDEFRNSGAMPQPPVPFTPSMTSEEVDTLAHLGRITPTQANELKARMVGESLRQEQADIAQANINRERMTQPNLYAQTAQQTADTVNMALQGTGVALGFQPIQQPLSPVGTPFSGIPSTLHKPAEEVAPEATAEIVAQEEAAATRAAAAAAAPANAQKARAAKALQIEKELNNESEENMKEVEKDTEGSDLWKNIGDAVAIMLGAYSQGLTGAKQNPGLAAVERRVEMEAKRRKYDEDKKAALEKLAYKKFMMNLQERAQLTKEANTQIALKKLYMDAEKQAMDHENATRVASFLRKGQITQEDLSAIPGKEGDDIRARSIPHPFDSNRMIITNRKPEELGKLSTYLVENGEAIDAVNSVVKSIETPNPKQFIPGTAEYAELSAKIGMLKGALKTPLTGTGPLTEPDFKYITSVVGDPQSFASLTANNIARLKAIQETMNSKVSRAYKNYGGITILPPSSEETLKMLATKYGVSMETARQIYQNNRKDNVGQE